MLVQLSTRCAAALGITLFTLGLPAYCQSDPVQTQNQDQNEKQGKIVTDEPDSRSADGSAAASSKPIIGDYRIVEGRTGDAQILPERLADVTVKITEKSITTYDGDRRQRFNATYKLDTSKSPWRIHMTPTEVAVPADQPQRPANTSQAKSADATIGLILLEPKTSQLKLIYALPGGNTPKDFKVEKNQNMFVLERLPTPKESTKVTPSGDPATPAESTKPAEATKPKDADKPTDPKA